MSRSKEKLKYRFLNSAAAEEISIDTICDEKSIHIIPEKNGLILFEHVKGFPRKKEGDVESTIRANTGSLLDGYELIASEENTIEVDNYIVDSMRKTPISFADGHFGKEFLPALILCVDLRRFSDYARDYPKERVKGFLEKYTQELLATINICSVSYYKLLGDGALAIWDKPGRNELDEALRLFDLLSSVLRGIGKDNDFSNNIAGGIVEEEVYKYEIYAESSGLKYRDYIGYGINYVFRLQSLAESSELLTNRSIPDHYGLALPSLASDRKPRMETLKGVKDIDYSEIFLLRPASK